MIKAFNGQSLEVTAVSMLEIPSLGVNGKLARILADQAGQIPGYLVKDPCK